MKNALAYWQEHFFCNNFLCKCDIITFLVQ